MASESNMDRERDSEPSSGEPHGQTVAEGDQSVDMTPSRNAPNRGEERDGMANTEDGEGEGEWASQEDYEQRTSKTTDVVVPDGGQRFRVRNVPPLQFASIVEDYGIDDLAADLQGVPAEATMDDTDIKEVLQMVGMFRDVVVPNVVRPRNAHWANPPSDPKAGEVFDLSGMTEDDIMTLIAAITGQDAEELINDGRAKARAQNRGQPENQRFR